MGVQELKTKGDFDDALLAAGGKLVVIDFFATWCPPCRAIAPKFAELSEKYSDVVFLKCDVDQVSEVAEQLNVSAMPTFLFFKNTKKIDEVVGASEAKLQEALFKNQ